MRLITALVACSYFHFVASAEEDGVPPPKNGTSLETSFNISNSEDEWKNKSTNGTLSYVLYGFKFKNNIKSMNVKKSKGKTKPKDKIKIKIKIKTAPENEDEKVTNETSDGGIKILSVDPKILCIIFGSIAGVVVLAVLVWLITRAAKTT